MSNQGWITVPRSIMDSAIWPKNSKYSNFEFYLYLKMRANFQSAQVYWGGELIRIERGQLVTSIQSLSESSKRSPKWVRKRIGDFAKLGLITHEKRHTHFTMLTICGYDNYDNQNTADGNYKVTSNERINGNAEVTQYNKINKNKKDNKKLGGKYEKFSANIG